MDRCWILVGMMGAGKTTIGRSLAHLAGRKFLDTDQMLQHRLGRSISQVFALYGEPTFRDHETSILQTLEPSRSVLSTGGGIVLREENWTELRRLGTTIYLRARPETLIERLGQSKKRRPLLEVDLWEGELAKLLESRVPLYEKADVKVDVDGLELATGAQRVMEALEEAGLC